MKKLHKKLIKYFLVLTSIILGIFLFANISIYFAFKNLGPVCIDEIVSEDISPNGVYKTITFVRNIGATSDFSTQVAILNTSEKFDTEACYRAIFTSDTDHGKSPPWQWGGPEIKTEWKDDKNLTIFMHPLTRTFTKEPSYNGVDITYEYLNK